jgi:hypothetical protein
MNSNYQRGHNKRGPVRFTPHQVTTPQYKLLVICVSLTEGL